MLRSDDDSLPLSAAEIANLTNQLKNLEYEVITKMDKTVMAIRVDRSIPDLMEDIERVHHQLDERDSQDLTHVVLIGNEEVILVKPDIIKALMTKRTDDEEVLIIELREKLDRFFGNITFKDERDPYGTIRFAVRAPQERVVREPSQMHDALTRTGGQIDADVFYIIGDTNFIRINRQSVRTLISVPETPQLDITRAESEPRQIVEPEPTPALEPVAESREPEPVSRIHPPLSTTPAPAEEPETVEPAPGIHPPLSSTPPPPPPPVLPEAPKMAPVAQESVSRFAEHFIDDDRSIESKPSRMTRDDSFDLQSELAAFMEDRVAEREGGILVPKFEGSKKDVFEATPSAEPEPHSQVIVEEPGAGSMKRDSSNSFLGPKSSSSSDQKPFSVRETALEPIPKPEFPERGEIVEEPEAESREPEDIPAFDLPEDPKDEDIGELLPPEPSTPEPEEIPAFDLPEDPKDEDIEELLPPEPSTPEPEEIPAFDLPEEPKDEDIEELLPPEPPTPEPEEIPAFDLPVEPKDEDIEELLPPEPPTPEPEEIPSFDLPGEPKDEDIEELLPHEPEEKPEAERREPAPELSQDSLEKFESREPEEISSFTPRETEPDDLMMNKPEPEPEIKVLPPKPALKIATKMPVKMVVKKPALAIEPKAQDDETDDWPKAEDEDISPSSLPPITEVPEMPEIGSEDEKVDEPEIDESELKTLLPEPEVGSEEPPMVDEPPEPVIPPLPGRSDEPPLERIAAALKESQFELVLDVTIDGIDIVVRSEQGKYEKIFVKFVEECNLDTVNDIEKVVEFYKGDVALIVGRVVPELITAFTLPEKIRVFSLDEFEDVCREHKLLSSD